MFWSWILLLCCGCLAGTIAGVAGFGGAILLMPVVVFTVGAKSAIPVLTVAQLLGNLSRAGFGRRDIRWRSALIFSAGAIPGSLIGSRLYVELDSSRLPRLIGILLLAIVALRHASPRLGRISERGLALAGVGVGFLSAVAGTIGPLPAAIFLGLKLPAPAYVATEAVAAVWMHATKALIYGRYAVLSRVDTMRGLILGASLVFGSWMGRRILTTMPAGRFATFVEVLLILSAFLLIFGV